MFKHKTNRSFRFRRYCRAAYAVFRSLHREVTIGHVATYIADRQLRKSACAAAMYLPLLLTGEAVAQSDDDLEGLTLPVVSITAVGDTTTASEGACALLTHEEIQNLTTTTVGQLLEALPSVDVRTRGVGDMQGDITMRGGTFDQVVVLLNGINISDPQTGHHNLDIPIDLAMVERIELLSASALLRYGVAAFCGGINIVTTPTVCDRVRAHLAAGSYGTATAAVSGNKQIGRWNFAATGAYNRSDGYRRNTDYSNANLLLQASRRDSLGAWQMQLGGQMKDFGSQAFYSLKYPDQFESTRTLTAAVQRQQKIGLWSGDMALYGRLHKDRFELFRQGHTEPPTWYGGHNYHLASSYGARLRATRLNLQHSVIQGRLTLGAEYRYDGIISNVLGDSLSEPRRVLMEQGDHYYTYGCSRHRGNAFAEQSLYYGDWEMTAAALLHANSTMPAGYGYSVTLTWRPYTSLSVAASVSRSDRQPTFTDLYYHSATQIANPLLHTETSHTADVAVQYRSGAWHATSNIYLRRGTEIIDWVRQPSESVWHSMNHSSIDAIGFDIDAGYRGNHFLRYADISYCYNVIDKEANGYVSQYALDYLRHKASASIAISPAKPLLVKGNIVYQYRIGGYSDLAGTLKAYTPVILINASVEYSLRRWTLFVEASNLLNRTYHDYGGIPLPGTTLMAGIRYGM